jgi:hypothetical protein
LVVAVMAATIALVLRELQTQVVVVVALMTKVVEVVLVAQEVLAS